MCARVCSYYLGIMLKKIIFSIITILGWKCLFARFSAVFTKGLRPHPPEVNEILGTDYPGACPMNSIEQLMFSLKNCRKLNSISLYN